MAASDVQSNEIDIGVLEYEDTALLCPAPSPIEHDATVSERLDHHRMLHNQRGTERVVASGQIDHVIMPIDYGIVEVIGSVKRHAHKATASSTRAQRPLPTRHRRRSSRFVREGRCSWQLVRRGRGLLLVCGGGESYPHRRAPAWSESPEECWQTAGHCVSGILLQLCS